ncbi:MAG: transglycosylase SLT domain-containing protein [Muribaculaceae bacterium]|nr:transglycosylase SLT domain-containing protein [Muribaculaceae bacterium]
MIKRLISYIAAVVIISVPQMNSASILELSRQFTDSTIIVPESMETDVHQMMENWYLRNYVEMDRDADASKDVALTDELLIKRLSTMPTVIEMPYNSIVRSYIEMYTQRRRQLVENMLGMSLYYMPIFEEALEREGVPLELKYLPIIESALNPDAVSKAGATGLWQFMIPTARGLGLEINSLIDERRDPYKSSESAAKYLKQLYSIFNDWSLAIAAYNCGPGNVTKALKRAGDGDGKKRDFWDIYNYLPKETRGYVPCFIAATYVMTYYPEHNISPALAKRPLITDSVHVTRRVHLQQISDVLNIPVEEIKILNPQYRESYIPGDIRPYSLVLPSKQIYSYLVSEDSISNHDIAQYARRLTVDPETGLVESVRDDGDYIITEKTQWHKVKRGETLTSIAKNYGVTLASLKEANGGISSVKRGQSLKIVTIQKVKKTKEQLAQEQAERDAEGVGAPPAQATDDQLLSEVNTGTEVVLVDQENSVAADSKPAASAATTKPSQPVSSATQSNAPLTITIKKGDTLTALAKRYGTTVAKIKQLNGMTNDNIRIGQKLKIR